MIWPILALALILRLPLLNQSLWLDEAIQALALKGWYGDILNYALADFQPPLYHFIGIVWTRLVGYSEIALRIPSLVTGVATVAITYKVASLLGDKKSATVAGFLAATNPFLVYYSQEGRTYMLTSFFVTVSFYYFILLMKQGSQNKWRLFLLFVSTLGLVWTSYLAWCVPLVQGMYVIYKKRWDILLSIGLACITLILWLPSLIASLSIGLGDTETLPMWKQVVGGTSIKALILTWVKWNIGRISFESNLVYGMILASIATIHAVVTYLGRLTIHKNRDSLVLYGLILALTAAVSLFVPAYSYARVLFLLPGYVLLLALPLSRLNWRWSGIVIGINLIMLSIYWVTPRFHHENCAKLLSILTERVVP